MRAERDSDGRRKWDEWGIPCEITDLATTEGLAPWMKRWVGRAPDEIIRTLSMDWASIRHPSVARFRDIVLKFRPFALARDANRWYLGVNRRNDEEGRDGTLYIESPLDPAVLEKCLAENHLEGDDVIREFFTHFHGVRDRPTYAENFERPEEWEPFLGSAGKRTSSMLSPDRLSENGSML